MRKPRIAVIAGYMPFFDEIMPPDYARDRLEFGRIVADALAPVGDVHYLGLVRDHATGRQAGATLAQCDADAVLLVPTMATPAGYFRAALENNPTVPVVIFAAHEDTEIKPDFDMPTLCRNSGNVGALMIGNILSRQGRPFRAVVGARDCPSIHAELRAALVVAALAGRIRKGRLGIFGRPLDGYDNVSVDSGALQAAIGLQCIDVDLSEWENACNSVTQPAIVSAFGTLAQQYSIDDRGRIDDVYAAIRMSVALQAMIEKHDLTAGAINCRGIFGVHNPAVASLGCLAVTQATTKGVPFTCTADGITAIAMLVGKTLGGAALYCELDAIDEARDAFLCANTGEGDFAWSTAACDCKIFASGADSGRTAPGCCVRHVLRPGPATVIGFSPRAGVKGGFVLLAMEGETGAAPDIALSVTAAWFRADMWPMRKAMKRWIEAGATHHCALSPGHLASDIADLAGHLGIAFERIQE